MMNSLQQAQILIVDDQDINIRVLQRILQNAGYLAIRTTTDPTVALSLFQECCPDILLLDLMMPVMDGFEVMARLRPLIAPGVYLPIIILTADTSIDSKRKALEQGAQDFITKPFDRIEVVLRIKNLLATRLLYLQVQEQNTLLQSQNEILDEKVRERTAALEMAQREVVERLAQANEFRDDHTGQHIHRVSRVSALLARQLGLSEEQVEIIRQAATLHDVGKIAIADDILLKPAHLSESERDMMRLHTVRGAQLLARGHSEVLKMAERIAASHHERWDGLGYPQGLKGEQIPLEGRIVAVVDVFDALVHERPYKSAWSLEDALIEMQHHSGSHFDPRVVEAFLALPHRTLW